MTTTLTIRRAEDVLAAAPVLIGFHPTDSVFMMTFGGRETFHARVDLGSPIDLILEPAVRYEVKSVVLVCYGEDQERCERKLDDLAHAFLQAGIAINIGIWTDGQEWHAPGGPGVPYDISTHPFMVQAVASGQVMEQSRGQLAVRLRQVPERAAALEALRPTVQPYDKDGVTASVWRAQSFGATLNDEEAIGVLLGIKDPAVRDAAWETATREQADALVDLWTDMVQRAPDDLVSGPASVLAFTAWLAGRGAMAWEAVGRCVKADPGNSLAGLVAGLLGRAVSPSSWGKVTESL